MSRAGRTLVPTKEGGSAGCAPVVDKGPPAVLLALVGGAGHASSLSVLLDPDSAVELGVCLGRAGAIASGEVLKQRREEEEEEDE